MSRELVDRPGLDNAAADLLELVASCAGVSVEDILLDERGTMQVARARHVAAWMLRAGRRSSGDVGKLLGGRVHKTIAQSCGRVEAAILLGDDKALAQLVASVARARAGEGAREIAALDEQIAAFEQAKEALAKARARLLRAVEAA